MLSIRKFKSRDFSYSRKNQEKRGGDISLTFNIELADLYEEIKIQKRRN